MPVALRPMRSEDAPGVGVMHHQAWVDTYGDFLPDGYFSTWTVEDAVDGWRTVLDDPTPVGATRIVAVESGDITGFAAAGPSRDVAGRPPPTRPTELWGLYVAAGRHGTGLGQRLLDAVLEEDAAAELWVFLDNRRARAFYQRNGFCPDGSTYTDERFPRLLEVRMTR